MNTLRALKQSLGLGAVLAAGTLLVTGVALATPGNDNSGGSPGNPHVAGTKGNPHAPGTRGRAHTQQATGNPHSGAPPYGVANARSASSSSSAGPTVAADHRNRENGNSSVDRANNGHPGKTTICHSTSSAKNPFVEITVANPSLPQGHGRHHDGDDIIPAPAGGCEALNAVAQLSSVSQPGNQTVSGVQSAERSGTSSSPGSAPGEESVAATPASANPNGSLPFTGLAVGALLSVGVVLLFCGWLVRSLALSQRP